MRLSTSLLRIQGKAITGREKHQTTSQLVLLSDIPGTERQGTDFPRDNVQRDLALGAVEKLSVLLQHHHGRSRKAHPRLRSDILARLCDKCEYG